MAYQYEIVVEGQRRLFILALSPDWARHVGDLTLIVALHGGGQAPEAFYVTTEIDALIGGTLTGTAEKVVAIFPRGLCVAMEETPVWNSGSMGDTGDLHALDDALFVKECIEAVNTMLLDEYARLTGAAFPTPPFFRRFLLCGFSNGGQMALRCNADLDRYDGLVSWGGSVVPDTLAVAECTSGGVANTFTGPPGDPYAYSVDPVLAGVILTQILPAAPANLIQVHSHFDEKIDIDGAIAPDKRRDADRGLGGAPGAGDGFYRWDLPSGVQRRYRTDANPPTTWFTTGIGLVARSGSVGIVPWLPTLTATGVVTTPHYTQWSWAAGGREARYLMADTRYAEGHAWPARSNAGWSFLKAAWEFLGQYFP